jgi:hypothetical protein
MCRGSSWEKNWSSNDAKLSNNAMIQEEDNTWIDSNYMTLAGFSHVEMLEETVSLGFVYIYPLFPDQINQSVLT